MNNICKVCGNELSDNFEFCPYCSNPISEKAKELEDKKIINAQLLLLAGLIKDIEEPKALYVLDKYVKMLSRK